LRPHGWRAALTLAAIAWLPGLAQAGVILDPARIREHTLANGLHIVVKEEHGWEVVALGLHVRVGSLHDPADMPGMAHFLEHMLFRNGETGGEPVEIVRVVEGQGGQINAETTRDFTLFSIVTSPLMLQQILPVLARTVLEPSFDPDLVRREKNTVSQEVAERQGRVVEVLTEAVWSTAYPNHPYGRSIGGTVDGLARIDAAGLKAQHARFYVPNNMSIVAVGDVDATALFGQVQQAFGKYARAPVEWTPPSAEAPLESPRVKTETAPVSATAIGLAFRGPGIKKKRDVCAMDLIYTLLGDGRKAWLETEVESKGLVTAYNVDFVTHFDDGLIVVTVTTAPDKELDARTALMAQFERLARDGVTEEQLTAAKRQLRNSYAFTNESYSDQVGSMGFYEMIDSHRFAIDYIDAVNAITPADLKSVAATYLDPQKSITVVFRPPAPTRPGGEV
jgi:predicted Zn-dependent peptidase